MSSMKIFFQWLLSLYLARIWHQRKHFTFGWLKTAAVLHIYHSRQISLKKVCLSHNIIIIRGNSNCVWYKLVYPLQKISHVVSPVSWLRMDTQWRHFVFPPPRLYLPVSLQTTLLPNISSCRLPFMKSTCRHFSSCTVDKTRVLLIHGNEWKTWLMENIYFF